MRAHKFVLSLALVAVALFSSSSLRSAAFVGTISGTVTNESAVGIVGVSVQIHNSSGGFLTSTSTLAGGAYSVAGLAAGTYYVRTFNSAGYVDEVWDDVECVSCNVTSGSPVTVVDSATTTIDFELAQGGTISGTVFGEGSPLVHANPAVQVFVTIVDAGNQFVTSSTTVAGGVYTTPTLPVGMYFARVSTNLGYFNEIWNNVQCQLNCQLTSADPIVVTAGGNASGISFDLQQGARFSGTVKNTALANLANVNIDVRNTANQSVASATTAADGTFTTSPGIPAGDYFLRTSNAPSYINETNDNLPCIGFCDLDGRTPVTAAPGVVTTGVNFELAAGGSISGTVVNALAAPLGFVTVNIISSNGSTVTTGFTDIAGVYTSRDGLLPGAYYVTTTNGLGYINEIHPGVACVPACTTSLGTTVNVAGTSAVSGINFSLAAGARITGHVTGAGGVDLSGVTVSVINAAGTIFSSGFTNAAGIYTTGTGLPDGSYYLRTSNSRGLINEVYPDQFCQGTLCPSPVGGGVLIPVTGGVLPFVPVTVNMDLAAGGRISGTVEDAGTSAAVVGATVQIYSLTGQSLGSSTTDGLGNYISSAGLTTGQFYVRTSNSLGYIDELFDNVVCGFSCSLSLGTDVGVTTGVETSAVDFQLALGGTISGTVVSGATPLGNLTVQIVNAATNAITSDTTDASGNFSVKGLVDGTYYARTSNTQGYINEVYNNLQCPLNCTNILGEPLVITGAGTVSGVSFDLAVGARISGVITDDVTTLPISGVSVSIVDPSGLTAATGTTNSLGEYISGVGLPTGNYYVRTNNSLGYVNELYNDISCATGCSLATGAVVSATAGGTTSGVNFGLSAGGRASGQVTDAGTGNPIQGIFVQIYDAAGRQVGGSSTDASGNFVTGAGLSTGNYYARTTNSQGYLDELFNNKPCVGSCSVLAGDAFAVVVGATTPNINFSLAVGGRVSGTITDATTSAPLSSVSVSVYDSTGRFVSSGGTNSFGVYTTSQGLATGTYYLRTNNGQGYINELFGGATCIGNCVVTSGTPISVTSPATTSGVDFALSAGGRITGTVTEVGGTNGPLAGVSVTIFNAAGLAVSGGSTNALGIYRTTAGLPDGTYTARTFNGQGLINQLHSGTTCLGQCDVMAGTPIVITSLAEVSGIDFGLVRGARVSGTITSGGNPVPGALGAIYDAGNVRVASGSADGSGTFVTSEGLPAGTYYARSENSVGLVNQVHAGLDCLSVCNPTAGTGIVLGGAGITSGINFTLTPDADGDGDGIVNTIDLQPAVFSNDFDDVAQGGITDGTVSNRFGTIVVGDVSPSGIQIDLPTAGGSPATFDVCAVNGTQRILLDASGESVVYACNATGSTSVRALNALPIVELRDPATGPGIIIQLGTGQGATTGSPVTALSTNTDAIVVIIVDATGTEIGSFELDAGESALVVVNPDGSADAEVIEGVVEITVRGESVVLEPGETHDFPPPTVVSYTFTGFFSPVSNLPAVNSQNAGSAMPVKFSLNGFQGLDVVMPGYPTSQPMSCTTWAPIGPAAPVTLNGTLTYDASSDRYSMVWKTVKTWSNSCRQFELLLDDGSTHRFNVKFKK